MNEDSPSRSIDLVRAADFSLGGLLVRPSVRQVEHGRVSQTLEPRIMQVLVALARRRGQVVSRDELIESCWGGLSVSDSSIHRCIHHLRKLGGSTGAFDLETISKVGYRMLAAEEMTPSATSPGPLQEHAFQGAAQPAQHEETPSLAVLPLTNLSGLAEDDVFAEGMVEDVISALSQAVNVRVLGSMATAGLRKGSFADLAAVGRQLGVRYLLEGNVRRASANLRMTAKLLEAASGAILWTARFDWPLSELAGLQEELVLEVAANLNVQVQALEMERALKKPNNLTAWEATMRSYAAYRALDGAALLRSIDEAARAVAIAPDYAAGHAMLSIGHANYYAIASLDNVTEILRIRAIIDRAIALQSEEAFVLTNLGLALAFIGAPQEALHLTARAIQKTPYDGMAQFRHGCALTLLNRNDEGLASYATAARLGPGSPMLYLVHAWASFAHLRAGRWIEAETACDESLALKPGFFRMRLQKAIILRHKGVEAQMTPEPLKSGTPSREVSEATFRRWYANSDLQAEVTTAIRAVWPFRR